MFGVGIGVCTELAGLRETARDYSKPLTLKKQGSCGEVGRCDREPSLVSLVRKRRGNHKRGKQAHGDLI